MKKIFKDIDNWLHKKNAWEYVFFCTISITGILFDYFFADHDLYPEFLKDWVPPARGLLVMVIAASPLIIYFLIEPILKKWENIDKYQKMNTKNFKNLILFQFFLTISLAIKALFYPYALAPEELSTAILAYDDLQPLPDTFTAIMIFVFLILSIVSLIMVYKFKKIGRSLYLIATAASFLLIFASSYFVHDPLELFLEATITFLSGVVISLAYFSNLSKSFK